MLWVHIPYASYKNDLIKVEQEIVAENGYESSDYFNRYDGEKSYYIIHGKKDNKEQYAVFNEKRNLLNHIVKILLINRYVLKLLKKNINILLMILK